MLVNFTLLKSNKIFARVFSFILGIFFSALRSIIPKYKSGKTVVIVLHKLGDAVFTIESVKRIADYVGEKIVIVCFHETTDILKLVMKDAFYLELSHSDFYLSDRIASSKARGLLRKINPQTIYDLTGSVTSASLIFNSSAAKIIGINEPFYKKIYNQFVPIRKEPHVSDIYLDAIKPLIDLKKKMSIVKPNRVANCDYIGIHPFAGWSAKEWGLKKFIDLAEYLSKHYCVKFVIPANKISQDILIYLKKLKIEVVETKSTNELIEFIRRSLIFIGNDSGPVHISHLLGIPTFTIYGPTNPDYHQPAEGVSEYVVNKLRCSPKSNEKVCFTNGGRSGCPAFECMNLLDTKMVLAKVLSFTENLTASKFIIENSAR